MAAGTQVKLVIPSQVKLIDIVHSASEKMAEVAGFDEDDSLNVGLAVREAVVNAIVHGNKSNPKLNVDVTLSVEARQMTAQIRDHGNGFDPDSTADVTAEENRMMTSGRGILLIRAFVDDVVFRKRSTGMEVTLTKRTPGAEKAQN